MDRERLDRFCEQGILALVLTILVFSPLAIGAVLPWQFLIVQALTLGVMVLWGIRLWANPRIKLLWPPICWAVLAFAGYAVWRYSTADIEYVARQEMIRVLVYAFLFLAILNNLHRQETTQIIGFTMISLAMLISFYSIYQFATVSDHVWGYTRGAYHHRGSGTFISPNNLAGFLELLLPLSLSYMMLGRLKATTKIFFCYTGLVIIGGLACTISRGGWVAAGLSLIVFFGVLAFDRSRRLPALIFLVVIIGACAVTLPKSYAVKLRVKQLFAQGHVDDDSRYDIWHPAVILWKQNPWWGVGPAHFDYRFRQYRPEELQRRPERAHNDYINTLADWGVAGTALVASAWLLLAWGIARTWPFVRGAKHELGDNKGSNKFAFLLGASLGLLALLFHSAVDFNMHIPANAILAITLMALISSQIRFATERFWFSARVWIKILLSLLLVAGIGYLGYQGMRRARESYWIYRAHRELAFSPERAQKLERAFTIEPKNASTAYEIGETHRFFSQQGNTEKAKGTDYTDEANLAMGWFEKCMKLNPWDGYGYMRYGWCLDWLGRPKESAPYFQKAEALDPNGYYTMAHLGLHYIELEDFAAARTYFERSKRLEASDNEIAVNYLQVTRTRLLERATNSFGRPKPETSK